MLAAVGYLLGARAVRRSGGSWPARRTAAALAGATVGIGALLPPLESARTVTAHTAQHLLLGLVVPLLLAAAAPVSLALRVSRGGTRRRLARALHSAPLRVLAHPLAGWAVFVATPYAVYLTPLYARTLRDGAAHVGVHALFLLGGLLFCWPLVAVDPVPGRPPYAMRLLAAALALPFHAFLGVALIGSARPIAPGVTTADQQAAGALLWGAGDLVALGLLGALLAGWVRSDRRTAAREDRASGLTAGAAGTAAAP